MQGGSGFTRKIRILERIVQQDRWTLAQTAAARLSVQRHLRRSMQENEMKRLSVVIVFLVVLVLASCTHTRCGVSTASQITVTVTGNVIKPGEHLVQADSDIAAVLAKSGANMKYVGGKPRPDSHYRITITRLDSSGKIQKWQLQSFELKKTEWKEFKFKNGDTIKASIMFS